MWWEHKGYIYVNSDDDAYRYVLQRPAAAEGEKRIAWVMLNPSTADEFTDDPTIRKCVKFSTRLGARTMTVVNLFAARSTDPRALRTMPDPVGPENDRLLKEEIDRADMVIAAWGTQPWDFVMQRALHVRALLDPAKTFHLGALTKDGSPRHPLYLRDDTPLNVLMSPR